MFRGQRDHSQSHVEVTGLGPNGYIDIDIDQSNQSSPVAEMKGFAVSIRNLYVSYEPRKPILKNLHMNVKEGSIYTLLGDSGCGKSTLLNTIVGLKRTDSGDVFVLNKPVNSVVGRCVGFMPQDTALYDQLSIKETMRYFGKIYGMAGKEIEEQILWLIEFLHLPTEFRLVKNLSGGMRRRCSLAVTLIHRPQLLILDEPTVGLDPLIRERDLTWALSEEFWPGMDWSIRIWEHLQKVVQSGKQTIIVTTHYLEEAKYANTVSHNTTKQRNAIGIMRKGRLIAENSPQSLLQRYDSQILQEVVLKLCHEDETNLTCSGEFLLSLSTRAASRVGLEKKTRLKPAEMEGKRNLEATNLHFISLRRIKAVSTMLWLTFLRHPLILGVYLLLPTAEMILTLLVVGTDPKDLKFGIVNHDIDCFEKDLNKLKTFDKQHNFSICDFSQSSCKFINSLSNSSTMTLVPIQTEVEAIEKVKAGELLGYFYFPSNYSKHLENFWLQKVFSENETLSGTRVNLRLDMSNYFSAIMAIQVSYTAYGDFSEVAARLCGVDPREVLPPLRYRIPVFDDSSANPPTYRDHYIPVILLTLIFEVSLFVSSILLIGDRKQGTMERANVAGLRFNEIMCAHVVTQGTVIIGQSAICTFILFLGFSFAIKGSPVLYFFILFLGGLFGTSLGIFLGVFLAEEVEALLVITAIFQLRLTFEGGLWPVEGMLQSARFIARYIFPSTLLIESLRSVLYRGVGLFHSLVWPGIVISLTWTIVVFALSLIFVIIKHR